MMPHKKEGFEEIRFTLWKDEKFSFVNKIFRETNSLVTSLAKALLSRNFCQKSVIVNFHIFHSVFFPSKFYMKEEGIFRFWPCWNILWGVLKSIRENAQCESLRIFLPLRVSKLVVCIGKISAVKNYEKTAKFKFKESQKLCFLGFKMLIIDFT